MGASVSGVLQVWKAQILGGALSFLASVLGPICLRGLANTVG